MTWNIWHGGLHGSKTDNFKKDTANTINILRVLQNENPDILFMQETYCCGMDIAKKAGYKYSCRGSSNLSIHSKYPIIDTIEIYKPFNSHAVIINVNGKKILCVNVWLHYLPDYFQSIKNLPADSLVLAERDTRLKEIKAIQFSVDSIASKLEIPVIVGGDFNSGSHLDWITTTKQYHYNKTVEWPVSKLMIDHGYIDSFREIHPDPTKTMEGTWGFLNEGIISDRIDYIYYKGKCLRPKSSKIVLEAPEGSFFNSDHRAILTSFEIN
jgi:exonuclease III